MKNAPVGPIGWRGRFLFALLGYVFRGKSRAGFRCWQAAWARAKALWNARLCSWSVCGEERRCSSCKKRKNTRLQSLAVRSCQLFSWYHPAAC